MNNKLLFVIVLIGWSLWGRETGFQKVELPGHGFFLYENDPYSEITVMQIGIRGGKRMDGTLAGLSWLSVKMGLEPHSSSNLYEMIEQGATLTSKVYGDFSLVSLRVLSSHFPKAVGLIRKSLFDPLVNSIRLDMINRTMAHYRDYTADSPDALAYHAQLKAFFPDDPYHHCEYGDEESSGKIKVADIKSFFSNSLTIGNIVLAVSSDLPVEELTKLLGEMIEEIPEGEPMTLSEVRQSPAPPEEMVQIRKERVQSLISTAWLLPAKTSKQRMVGFLLKTLLSDGVGSKFWALRSEKHLIYSSYADLLPLSDRSLLMITLRCEDSRKNEAVLAMIQILQELVAKGVDSEMFSQIRNYAQTTFFRDSENKEEKCFWAVTQNILGMQDDFLTRFEAVSAEVSLEDFNRFLAEQLVPEKQSLVTVGPVDKE